MSDYIFKIGKKDYPIEDSYIVGFFEEEIDEQVQWNLVVEFPGEDVFASFENITLKNVHNFDDLENKSFILEDDENEEFFYEGLDDELVYIDEIHFQKVDKTHRTIEVRVIGIATDEILEEEDDSEEDIELEGEELDIFLKAEFEGIYFITKNKKNVEKFVKDFLKKNFDEVEIEYEENEEEKGYWNCIIRY